MIEPSVAQIHPSVAHPKRVGEFVHCVEKWSTVEHDEGHGGEIELLVMKLVG